ncbi:c-type cytochrome [Foetidibacter luteolus]|uniref:c-type cytochrome n=1 Tax=Foetidibacter luteolus TaxID=2608880 RepID=UPI00129ABE36|nr:cytochrome c [Foetidibacter luteolus]
MNKELIHIVKALPLIVIFFLSARVAKYAWQTPGNLLSEDGEGFCGTTNEVTSPSVTSFPEGRNLFMANCASCHSLSKNLTGPALAGVTGRVNRKLLHEWIKNSPKVLKSGNKYFNELFLQYDKIPMSSFPNLTDAEIDAILDYIDNNVATQVTSMKN